MKLILRCSQILGNPTRRLFSRNTTVLAPFSLLLLGGCAVGPDYKKPPTPAPIVYSDPGPWKEAAPKDALSKGPWWEIFNDPALSGLEKDAVSASPTIQASLARLEQARAIARISSADFYPSLSLDPSASRARYSGNRPIQTTATRVPYTANTFLLPLDLNYEIDLFGRVRRSNESIRALAQAGEAAYQNLLLSLEANIAQTYFVFRSLGDEYALVNRSIETRRQALDLVLKRYRGGASGELDVRRAETELANAEADAIALEGRRRQLSHSLAVLCGQMPSSFSLPDAPLTASVPLLPVGLPSELLERRPDVAQAERALASANALIGVAKAAFFPSIHLIGSAGYNSDQLDSLFHWDSRQWSLGPFVSLPIFQGGRNKANYERAKAAYDEAISNYRQSVLIAFQDVEDGLSGLRLLENETQALKRAAVAARQAADLSTIRYKSGLVSYLEVVDSERTALQAERALTQVQGQRLTTSVFMIKALGGGWTNLIPAS